MIIDKDSADTITRIVEVLSADGVIIMPCDTIYGIVGVVPGTEQRIREVKGRGEKSPFLWLIPSSAELARYSPTVIPDRLLALWPGPLTLIVHDFDGGTVGLRVPDDPFLIEILTQIDSPLYSTSVNISGRAPMSSVSDIAGNFEKNVDLIVDGGTLEGGVPSTIVNATQPPYSIVRQGAMTVPLDVLDP